MTGTQAVRIGRRETLDKRDIQALSDVLMDCVESGASIGFMAPMTRDKAEAFWCGVSASAAQGERVVLVAEDMDGKITGTIQVIWALPEKQPHRGDIAKMMVRPQASRQDIGAALLAAAERCALEADRTLLVLDTANDVAERLYVRAGWQRVGIIPRYALFPGGGWCATTILFKDLRDAGSRP